MDGFLCWMLLGVKRKTFFYNIGTFHTKIKERMHLDKINLILVQPNRDIRSISKVLELGNTKNTFLAEQIDFGSDIH